MAVGDVTTGATLSSVVFRVESNNTGANLNLEAYGTAHQSPQIRFVTASDATGWFLLMDDPALGEMSQLDQVGFFRAGVGAMLVIDPAGVSIGDKNLDAAAILELTSTTQGLLLPRMTTTERNAIASPPDGLLIYNTTTAAVEAREGGAWVNI